jgi:hypothetical protein
MLTAIHRASSVADGQALAYVYSRATAVEAMQAKVLTSRTT